MSLYKRIGVILPSTNTTVENDFFKMSPDGVTVHFHRVLRKSGLIGDYEIQEEMNQGIHFVIFFVVVDEIPVIIKIVKKIIK